MARVSTSPFARPHHEFGRDVLTRIDQLRHAEHRSVPERTVTNLLDHDDELQALSVAAPARRRPAARRKRHDRLTRIARAWGGSPAGQRLGPAGYAGERTCSTEGSTKPPNSVPVRHAFRGSGASPGPEELGTAARDATVGPVRPQLRPFARAIRSSWPDLFVRHASPDLPRPTNDLEPLFGSHKYPERWASLVLVASSA